MQANAPLQQITIQLFTRQQCSLCNHAKYFIHRIQRKYPQHQIKVEEVYIDNNPELLQQYTNIIPVIMVNQKEACREKPNEKLLREAVDKEIVLQNSEQKTIEQLQLEMQQNQQKVEEMQEMEHLLRKTIFRGLRATIIFVSAMLLFFKVMKKKNDDTKTQKLKKNTPTTTTTDAEKQE